MAITHNPPPQTGIPPASQIPPPNELSAQDINSLATNDVLHELTHSLLGDHHCGYWDNSVGSLLCVIYSAANKHMLYSMQTLNSFHASYQGRDFVIRSAWHAREEVNAMLGTLNAGSYHAPDPGF